MVFDNVCNGSFWRFTLGGYHLGATPFLRTTYPIFCNIVQNGHATLSIFALQLWVIIFYNKQPRYRINQSSVVHKGLSWFIFAKNRQILTFFWFLQKYHTASVSNCTLRQSMKFANRVFIIRWGFVFVYGQDWCFLRNLHRNLVDFVLLQNHHIDSIWLSIRCAV